MPSISLIVNTYEGAEVLPRALRSVLAQDLTDVEVVVADDGSSRSPEALVRAEFPDAPLTVVTHPNGGLSAARNLGLRAASGDFVWFLDDDDELLPGAVEALRSLVVDGVGVVSGAAEVVHDGTDLAPELALPRDQGPETEHQVVCNLAGSWMVARDVLDAVGGFDEDLRCNHQREMFLRVLPWCVERGRPVVSTTDAVVRIHRQPPSARPRNDPARLQGCLEHLLDKHGERIARNPRALASLHASAGVAAARNGRPADARAHFVASLRAEPRQPRTLGRLALTAIPPLARRVWGAAPSRPAHAPSATRSSS